MAESLVSHLRETVGHRHPISSLELVPSGGGVFDVFADGDRIFSKSETHRFPNPGEMEKFVLDRLPQTS